jgi:hypothetical protein
MSNNTNDVAVCLMVAPMRVTLCGKPATSNPRHTTNPEKVTCELCKKIQANR